MRDRTICVLAALFLLLAALAGCEDQPAGAPLFAERGEVTRAPMGELAPASDAEAVLAALLAAGQTHAADWDAGDSTQTESGLALAVSEPAPGGAVVTDGSSIYMLDSYGLLILSAAGRESELLSYTRVERAGSSWSERLFLGENRVAVVYAASGDAAEDGSDWNNSAEVHVVLLDTADRRAPAAVAETTVEGSLLDARLLNGMLCLVTQQNLLTLPEAGKGETVLPSIRENGKTLELTPGDVYLCPDPTRAALTLVTAVRLEDGRVTDALAFTDGTEAVRADGSYLYLTRTRWDETASAPYREEPYTVVDYTAVARTEIRRLRLDGGLTLNGGCVLDGALPDAAALDLRGGSLRAVTQTDNRSFAAYTDEKHGWTNYEERSHSRGASLTVLDGELNVTGALTELGGKQGVSAGCFAGELAWLSAAGDTESVYPADLSDPAAPTMTVSLPVTGERLVLRSFGDGLVLGLAASAAGEDWQLLMFDVSDPSAPREADRLSLRGWTPASAPTALFTDPANCLIAFPAAGKSGMEYLLIGWTGSALKQKGAFELEYIPADACGLLLDGLLYICSPGEVYVTDPETMTVLKTVSNAVG